MGRLPEGSIRVRDVSRRFRIVHEKNSTMKEVLIRRRRVSYTELWALRDVSFSIHPGETVGLVGRNGSGKSTLLKLLAGIIPPHEGTIETSGSMASMLELGSGFHPDFTGRENVFMNGAIQGLSEQTIRERFDEIVEFAELRPFIDMPVRTYSSGMQMRLAYAVAAHVTPDILLLDEVLAVGDTAFQEKCIDHIHRFTRAGGTLVFVSHAPDAVTEICDRAILMDAGQVRADGPTEEIMGAYAELLESGEGEVGGDIRTVGPFATGAAERAGDETRAPVTISGVSAVSSSGRPAADGLSAGEEVTITVDLDPVQPVPAIDIALHLTDGSGDEIVGTCSSEAGVKLDIGTSPTTLTARLALPAQEGVLDLTVVLRHWPSGQVIARQVCTEMIRMLPTHAGTGAIAVPVAWTAA